MPEDTEVVYTFRAEDKISGPMKNAETQLKATEGAADSCTKAQERAVLKSVETLSAMQALQSGVGAVTHAVTTLGMVDDETANTLQKLTAGIQLVVGTAQAIKGVVTLFQSLNAVLKTTAIVSTFASIAENPVKGAAIIGAAGLAAGAVAGYLYSSTQTTNTTINVGHEETATARQVQQAAAFQSATTSTGTWY